jgi:hypothetical protein
MSHSLGPISFGNRKFHAANEKAQNALMRGLVFFFFFFFHQGRDQGRDFLFSPMFSMCSHQVPKCSTPK